MVGGKEAKITSVLFEITAKYSEEFIYTSNDSEISE
jgi:hypothetical protein